MKFAIESWDPGYGRSVGEDGLDDPNEPVDVGVEIGPGDWRPLTPSAVTDVPVLYFVDGVRRTDAQVWVRPPGEDPSLPSIAGVCATVAAGVVECTSSAARIVDARVERGFYTAAPQATSIQTRHGTYELRPIVAEGTDPLNQAIHSHMTAVEHQIAADFGNGIVIFDGPLRGRESPAAVGYVKTQHVQYLPPEQHGVVGRLDAGQRTPLFLIGGRYNRWSWYLRLPGPISHPLSGVVRVELPGLGQTSDAADRADLLSALLPRFASQPHKDARAPQNLHPIAGLERELRRRLGDQQLLERALRRAS
ncbi:MAG: hypothetical protein O3C27_01710 [Actinomycetota bacterium]|nr:hypothetical protein [Actinomycetota bacterium]